MKRGGAEAKAYEIVDRRRPFELSFADIGDFSLERSGAVAADELVANPDVTLYTLDFDRRRAVFVETPPAEAPSEAPFYHTAQFERAMRVMTLPFAEFVARMEPRSLEDEKVIFVHSVGRAGSTLASRVFAAVDGVESVSEPDALTRLVAARHDPAEDAGELQALLEATVRFLCASPGPGTWAIKGRSQVTAIGDWLHRLHPGARTLFLYRDAESWLASAKRAFLVGELGPPEIRAAVERVSRRVLAPYTPLVADHPHDRHLTAIGLAALTWLSAMESALEMVESGVEMLPIRYASWSERPEETAIAMLEHCGCRPSDLSSVRDALRRDSQAGTAVSRERTRRRDRGLEPGDLHELRDHLRDHPRIRSPDFEIPGTWST